VVEAIKKNQTTIKAFIGVAIIGIGLFVYLTWYVSPDEITERVEVIANTSDGCIVETYDGYSINIGSCNSEPGDFIVATYDAKEKERRYLMNPTD